MISSQQLRAARALLGYTQERLCAHSGVEPDLLAKAESDDGERQAALMDTLERFFADEGIVFIEDGENGGGAGVRLKHPNAACNGIRPEDLNSANDG